MRLGVRAQKIRWRIYILLIYICARVCRHGKCLAYHVFMDMLGYALSSDSKQYNIINNIVKDEINLTYPYNSGCLMFLIQSIS